ncbi:hypothetical protein [Gimibacter soli]|uniref:Uncharacterized protein n=1 Tax=Gimibacter soli TaxID=3024400 RepID=A0AAE9XW99_9PROT|nr:hypothetical protein [Gimibacter soli]WCL55548.1 hypothetical protein PH603_07210 [Gimibacter soli]
MLLPDFNGLGLSCYFSYNRGRVIDLRSWQLAGPESLSGLAIIARPDIGDSNFMALLPATNARVNIGDQVTVLRVSNYRRQRSSVVLIANHTLGEVWTSEPYRQLLQKIGRAQWERWLQVALAVVCILALLCFWREWLPLAAQIPMAVIIIVALRAATLKLIAAKELTSVRFFEHMDLLAKWMADRSGAHLHPPSR